jgi:hypothetical protein
VEIDHDLLITWEHAPAALAVVDGRDPGARVPLVDGEADGLEAELAGRVHERSAEPT